MGVHMPQQTISKNLMGCLFKWEHDKLYMVDMLGQHVLLGNTYVDTTNLCGACRERRAAEPGIPLVRRHTKRREWHDLRDFAGEMVVRHVEAC